MGKKKKEREQFFLKNGGKMLEQMISIFNGKCNPIRSFSEEDLMRATNNYDRRKIRHEDWNFCIYEGTIESRSVLVKKFKKEISTPGGGDPLELVTNETAIASNMSNHKNFLKLLGCCLETEIPILVYEFGENLSRVLVNSSLPWETKLRIANEIANAVAYVHYGTSRVIIHRDIKIGHIYLNRDNIAKLSEFQMSVPIPSGETHVDTLVFGTTGHSAPEVLTTGRLTEKSDVYNFGVVLMDILSGKSTWTWISELRAEDDYEYVDTGFADTVQLLLRKSNLKEEKGRQRIEFEELILKCLRQDPDARPTMQEVAQAIKSIRNMSS
ncbi:non-functional pseudokinase ZED1-like [Tripterygium wilfordii]|uniref:non-functional pseudokinase ZED1-like n=1 Tax=Tripterygium wilfordii TaxID=458696 RepID=UPI0018F83F9F|nr:non-functional pseudokinase ZED1-like [Tripterygium wilfordii]